MESAMEGRLPREVACFDAVVARVEEFRESLLGRGAPSTILGSVQ
jgi:hypothetical protein